MKSSLARWLICVVLAGVALQLFFIGRIVGMLALDPQSTTFQRSEAWRLVGKGSRWQQTWVPYARISSHLKRAVVASEDDGFASHDGVDWGAIESAWQKNAKAQAKAEQTAQARAKQALASAAPRPVDTKVIGGSTITQQLAKNLFLSAERTLFRKSQEFVLTLALELFLGKKRILEIYLNNVEWGEGIFGIEAAAQHYFRKPASQLGAYESARLAVMLPRPKYFQKHPDSEYLSERAGVMVPRMERAVLP